MSKPFATFAALKNQGLVLPDGDGHFKVERHLLLSLMAERIADVKFDEAWYLSKYPDVKEAVKRGVVKSGRDHYLYAGFYEDRMPAPITVNERWYLEAYPDVAAAIRKGIYKSGQAHFDLAGFREGRLPYANFQF